MRIKNWAAVIAVTGVLMSCNDNDDDPIPAGTFYGNTVNIGNGTGRTFVNHTDDHDKMQLGITFSAAALEGLPHHEGEFVLDFPEQAKSITPFDHILMGWMGDGHPDPIYNKAHFDIHFYMISQAERETISPDKPEMALVPDSVFIPANYFSPDNLGVPKMGRHWADLTSPELQPQGPPFTTTLILGTYNGKVIFWEPMITRDFLLSKPDTVMAIPQPKAFQKKSHYPTKYEIHFDEEKQQYSILLSGFEHR